MGKYGGVVLWDCMVGTYCGEVWWGSMVGKCGGEVCCGSMMEKNGGGKKKTIIIFLCFFGAIIRNNRQIQILDQKIFFSIF